MEITIRSTEKIVAVNGIPTRIWEGATASGIRVHAYITRVAVKRADDATEFQQELQECIPPSEDVAAIPAAIKL